MIAAVKVPFCAGCIAQHRAEAETATPVARALSYLNTVLVLPMIFSIIAIVVTLRWTLAMRRDDPAQLIPLAMTAFFVIVFLASAAGAVRETARLRVPPQTDVTVACDYSDDISAPFDAERRVYAIKDPAFAESFAASNRDRVWTPTMAASSRRRSMVVAAVLFALVAGAWLWMRFA